MSSICEKIRIGIDIGSKTLKTAIIAQNKVEETFIYDHKGNLSETLKNALEDIVKLYSSKKSFIYGICGNIDLGEIETIDSILASVEANRFLGTGCKNILSIGCESFYLVLLDHNGNYKEHSVNPMCASGTGSFLDQQAERIGLSIEELSEQAFAFKGKTPPIATRCAVFAKSDIIHAQANGFHSNAIAAGLCKGMSRSILSQLIKGKQLKGGMVLTGGVSRNRMIASEIANQLEGHVKVIDNSPVFNAIGAALLANEEDLNPEIILESISRKHERRGKLKILLTDYPDFESDKKYIKDDLEIIEYETLDQKEAQVIIGIDIGSTSTKAVVLDSTNNKILVGLYARTSGMPLEVTKNILRQIKQLFSRTKLKVRAVGTTGSGRNLVKEIINADLVVNEITAHAKGALFLDPQVDTIIEIGGQDSKFTQLENGQVVHAAMNYVCAAGTGSFIEEQAFRLGISLDEIAGLAMGQKAPYTSDRCTVYMERDLNLFQVEGFNKAEIITAVLHSVRDNYLSKVVGKLPLGKRIFFQGATARNKALVAAFEQEIKKPISVSKFCHLTGALGTAILAGHMNKEESQFAGLDFSYESDRELCSLCQNQCELSLYKIGDRTTAWGLKCGREYDDKRFVGKRLLSHLERNYNNLFKEHKEYVNSKAITVGLTKGLYQAEFYSVFRDFFLSLGCEVVIEESSEHVLEQGNRLVNSDFCAPVVLVHGMVQKLLDRGVDFIFLPALVNEKSLVDHNVDEKIYREKVRDSYFCYYSSYAPSIIFNIMCKEDRKKIIAPNLSLDDSENSELASIISETLVDLIDENLEFIKEQFIFSMDNFRSKQKVWKDQGIEILNNNKNTMKIMLLGRPYSIFDKQLNLGIPSKLEEAGFELLYQSMVDIKESECPVTIKFLEKMQWFYGQEILKAAEVAAKSDNIYPVFLSCFRCSPDSYLLTYVKEIFKSYNKPYLVIQLDEHTSDVGYQTRIEAAVDTFKSHFLNNNKIKPESKVNERNRTFAQGDTILVPFVSDIVSKLQSEAFAANGFDSVVVPLEKGMINRGYRYASGGECMPNVAIIGSVMEYVERERLDPKQCTVYLPGLCMSCNFNQYTVLFENACENSDLKGLKIYNGNMIQKIEGISKELNVNIMEVGIAGSLLYKLYFRFAPYEKFKGSVKEALNRSQSILIDSLKVNSSLHDAMKEIRIVFEELSLLDIPRKPRAIVVGDFYAKYNNILNQNLTEQILELGAEVIIPSFTETIHHFLHEDVLYNRLNKKYHKGLELVEKRFELIFRGLLEEEILEPPMDQCTELADRYSYDRSLAGETAISLGRVLYMLEKRQIEAIVHINPVFCCPGVVSSSIFQRIKEEYNVPVIDLFYDGTNQPNDALKPQLYYLCNKA